MMPLKDATGASEAVRTAGRKGSRAANHAIARPLECAAMQQGTQQTPPSGDHCVARVCGARTESTQTHGRRRRQTRRRVHRRVVLRVAVHYGMVSILSPGQGWYRSAKAQNSYTGRRTLAVVVNQIIEDSGR